MKHVNDFLELNGLSITFLNHINYRIKMECEFENQEYKSKMFINGFEYTNIDIVDAIVALDLMVRIFFVQWKLQYQNREYLMPEDGKRYFIEYSIKGNEYYVLNHKGLGFFGIPFKAQNLMLLVSMLSIHEYINESSTLRENVYFEKLLEYSQNLPDYLDMSLILSPTALTFDIIRKFFNLNSLSIDDKYNIIDDKLAEELFSSFIKRNT